jgi:hypothetical protein
MRFGALQFYSAAEYSVISRPCHYYVKLTGFAFGKKNRAKNCLMVCNFKLDDVFFDAFGKAQPVYLTRCLNTETGILSWTAWLQR